MFCIYSIACARVHGDVDNCLSLVVFYNFLNLFTYNLKSELRIYLHFVSQHHYLSS